jgi:hypothetical protein
MNLPGSVGKPGGKRQLGEITHMWKDNIKMDRKEIGFEVIDWIYLAQEYPEADCYVQRKSEAAPLHAMEAHGGRGGIATTHS